MGVACKEVPFPVAIRVRELQPLGRGIYDTAVSDDPAKLWFVVVLSLAFPKLGETKAYCKPELYRTVQCTKTKASVRVAFAQYRLVHRTLSISVTVYTIIQPLLDGHRFLKAAAPQTLSEDLAEGQLLMLAIS